VYQEIYYISDLPNKVPSRKGSFMKKTRKHHFTKFNSEALVTDIFNVLGTLAKKLFLEEYTLLRN
jgi:hypothetical protein